MSKNRISTCTSDFGCIMNPFYVMDRFKDPFQSSSGIDVNPYEFNKYESFNNFYLCGENCPYRNDCPYKENCQYRKNFINDNREIKQYRKISLYSVKLILILCILVFLIYKIK